MALLPASVETSVDSGASDSMASESDRLKHSGKDRRGRPREADGRQKLKDAQSFRDKKLLEQVDSDFQEPLDEVDRLRRRLDQLPLDEKQKHRLQTNAATQMDRLSELWRRVANPNGRQSHDFMDMAREFISYVREWTQQEFLEGPREEKEDKMREMAKEFRGIVKGRQQCLEREEAESWDFLDFTPDCSSALEKIQY